jgi:hypothetical protein
MKIPFEYGELVSDAHFVNRDTERQRLKQNFTSGISTMLISPRRWGKSSLVKQVAMDEDCREMKFCFVDMFGINDEEEFYKVLTREVLKATANKLENILDNTKKFLKKVKPKISMGLDPINDIEIDFDYASSQKNYEEILNLAEQIARDKKIRLVICIDEFQNLERFNDSLLFQQRLRSVWQHHKHASYCLYGSKKHMMIELFQNKSMPFYKFGDVMFLEKISEDHWVKYISKQFRKTKKKISKKYAVQIAETVCNHSYYLQQLAHLVWIRTDEEVNEQILKEAINDLLNQNSILYRHEMENLTNTQIRYLQAMAKGEEQMHSAQMIHQYKLGSSSNVSRIKEALEKKEILDTYSQFDMIIDPMFEYWIKHKYAQK